ncbi:EAL domain-containing protein [Thiohalocapsa marina]|uniref:EAL domain-containing protein n=1 Tax=Thiohalocapsa marina TaxID=424902 RepID=A0A5M8FFK3_9GAMM|nr:bifunctional diguanylate cyclase/phosphodiesterase [Thiohalocapsa marina]KAA6183469.1 EAL domain-containing protein [Thiohalocapsa marina]
MTNAPTPKPGADPPSVAPALPSASAGGTGPEPALQALLDALPEAAFLMAPDGTLLALNQSLAERKGRPRAEMLGTNVFDLLDASTLSPCRKAVEQVLETGQSLQFEDESQGRTLVHSLKPVLDDQGRVIQIAVFGADNTERRQIERQLQESESRFRTLFEQSQQATLLIEDGHISAANRAALRMLRLDSPAQLLGRSVVELSPAVQPDGRPSAEKAAELTRLALAQGSCTFEWQHLRADGQSFPAQVLVTRIRHQGKELLHNVWQDLTEQKRARERIDYLAYHDTLTALPNRVLGQQQLAHALAAASRQCAGLAVLSLDLEKFKDVNDSHGHAVGDRLLQAVARRLTQTLRSEDHVWRLSGDEFMVIVANLPATNAASQASAVCHRLLAHLVAPYDLGSVQLAPHFAVGVAVYPRDGREAETLMRNANTALRAAKESGQHGYCLFEPSLGAALNQYVATREALQTALEQDGLELHYQPQVDLRSGQVLGVEALLRCRQQGDELMVPGAFIGAAEESGLIVPMGRWVLREACRQTAAWQAAGLKDLTMAVNLSAVQFRHPELMTDVFDALAGNGLDPGCLELELTESLLLQNAALVQQTVRSWKARGIRLAIDDFGTGYSSLAYLKHFKVDKLKIDRSFIIDILQDEQARAIVQAMIQMARSLDLRTIAEGVEAVSLAEQLRIMGCDEAQGFLYARPLPAQALFAWMQQRAEDARLPAAGHRRRDD